MEENGRVSLAYIKQLLKHGKNISSFFFPFIPTWQWISLRASRFSLMHSFSLDALPCPTYHTNSGAASISDARRGSLKKTKLCTKRAKQTPLALDRGMTALTLSHRKTEGCSKSRDASAEFHFPHCPLISLIEAKLFQGWHLYEFCRTLCCPWLSTTN